MSTGFIILWSSDSRTKLHLPARRWWRVRRRPRANRGKELMKSTLRWRTPWNSTTTKRSCRTRGHTGVKNKHTPPGAERAGGPKPLEKFWLVNVQSNVQEPPCGAKGRSSNNLQGSLTGITCSLQRPEAVMDLNHTRVYNIDGFLHQSEDQVVERRGGEQEQQDGEEQRADEELRTRDIPVSGSVSVSMCVCVCPSPGPGRRSRSPPFVSGRSTSSL